MDDLDKKLKQADADYGVGNFRAATRAADAVQSDQDATEGQKKAAAAVLHKMRSDPIATVAFGATFFILVFLVIKFAL